MFIKYTNIFHCKTIKMYLNYDFWSENEPSGNPDGPIFRQRKHLRGPGANPMILQSYASVSKFYNATGCLVHFENKRFSSTLKERSSLLQLWRCSCKLRSCRIGPRSSSELPFQPESLFSLRDHVTELVV
jgi:hypothetical protein